MTNKQLLEKLQSLTAEQLAQKVDVRTEHESFTMDDVYIVTGDVDECFEEEAPPVGTVILMLD